MRPWCGFIELFGGRFVCLGFATWLKSRCTFLILGPCIELCLLANTLSFCLMLIKLYCYNGWGVLFCLFYLFIIIFLIITFFFRYILSNSTIGLHPTPHFLIVASLPVHCEKLFKITEELSIDAIENTYWNELIQGQTLSKCDVGYTIIVELPILYIRSLILLGEQLVQW